MAEQLLPQNRLVQAREAIESSLQKTVATLFQERGENGPEIVLEDPKDPANGDWSCYGALGLAKRLGQNPRQLAERLIADLSVSSAMSFIGKTEIAGPGFINITLQPTVWQSVVIDVLKQGNRYGQVVSSVELPKVMVEFVSANPTGPLHVGHARQAALGDLIVKLFQSQGHEAIREFYYNDAGQQIENLARSVQARAKGIGPDSAQFPVDGYRGEYIESIARAYQNKESVEGEQVPLTVAQGDVENLDAIRQFAVAYLRREQELDLAAFGLKFDVFSLESALYNNGLVAQVIDTLKQSGYAYEQDGALWLRTTDFGDDKDRVMKKSDGGYTYFVPDLAYHVSKWQRGFKRAINVQGMDHHGTIARVRAGLQALKVGIPQGWPDYVLHKMVTVIKDGQEVKISKRAGSYVTLRDLIDWAGRDAVRFFLISRKADTEFVFDVNLAQEQTENNPVFYVQYAHARICAVLAQANTRFPSFESQSSFFVGADLSKLDTPEELVLMRLLARYPAILVESCRLLAPHLIAFYVRELAQKFHSYYNAHRILVEDEVLCRARLALLNATKQVLVNALLLLGVSAPERM